MSEAISFDEFCRNNGFQTYPFSSFTAENERDKQSALFIATSVYSPLSEAFDSGQTMIVCGDRGTGKTATTYDFVRRADPKTLICQIDDFSPLPKEFSEQKFYKFILSEISNRFFSEIAKNTIRSRLLSDDEKILLTYYYLNFASDATRGLAQRTARRIQVSPVRRLFFWFYDVIRNPLNVVANAGATLIADIVAKAIGVNSITAKVTEYFPEIVAGVETDLPEAEATLEALRRFSELVRKAGFTRIVLIIDKIDEDPRFDNAAEEIADFIEPILKNNKFLLDESLQVVISLWIVPLNFLERV